MSLSRSLGALGQAGRWDDGAPSLGSKQMSPESSLQKMIPSSRRTSPGIWYRSPERLSPTWSRPRLQSASPSTVRTGPVPDHLGGSHQAGGAVTDGADAASTTSVHVEGGVRKPCSASRDGYSTARRDVQVTNVGQGMEGSPGVINVGRRGTEDASSSAASIPPETFVDSLRLDSDQLADFHKEGHFLYLRRKSGPDSTAYNLEVASCFNGQVRRRGDPAIGASGTSGNRGRLQGQDYYTLSRAGITRLGDSSGDFTPLDRWEKEYAIFHEIKRIPFFERYRRWKSYTVWKRIVKTSKFTQASSALNAGLFSFVQPLRMAIVEIRQGCIDLEQCRLFAARKGEAITLEAFVEQQRTTQQDAAQRLLAFSARVHEVARASLEEVVDAFLQTNGIVADRRMTFMERTSLRSECRRLTRFLRLVDFVVVDTLRDLVLGSFAEVARLVSPRRIVIMHHLRGMKAAPTAMHEGAVAAGAFENTPTSVETGDGRRRSSGHAGEDVVPLFRVSVDFVEDGEFVISPSAAAVTESFRGVLTAFVDVIGIPKGVLTSPDLAAYIMTDGDDDEEVGKSQARLPWRWKVGVQNMVRQDDRFGRLSNEIFGGLKSAFEQVEDYIRVFEPYSETFEANNEHAENAKHVYTNSTPLEEFRNSADKYKKMAEEFEGIPARATVGIMDVDSEHMRMRIMPSPLRCLSAIKELLPELLEAGSVALLDELDALIPHITGSSASVEKFVAKKRAVVAAHQNNPGHVEARQRLRNMASMMKEYGWRVPEAQRANLIMVEEHMTALENGIQVAESTEQEETQRFAETIREEVPKLAKKIAQVRERLDNSLIANLDASEEEVLRFLGKEEEKLGQLKDRATELMDYQALLGQNVDEIDILDEVVSDLNLKKRLWTGVGAWRELTSTWLKAPFTEIDAAVLEKNVMTYQRICHQAVKGLPSNPVAKRLKDDVDHFSPTLPVVVDLRNQGLQDRHWDRIHELIGFEIKGKPEITLGELLEKKVTDFHEEITGVATSAVQEAVLEEMMEKVAAMWRRTEFEVKNYKDVKGLYILGDISEVVTNLDDSLVTINTVLGSRYVGGIREMVDAWRGKLVTLQETLDEWQTCQRTWMYLESIFGSPDIVRQLPAAAKMFQAVDRSWRHIMSITADEPLAIKQGLVGSRKETFASHNAALDKIQKSLEEYLETKRAAFPRFYFLSNDELLEILSQAKDPQAVQPHLRKCFDNLVGLAFGDEPGSIDIHSMVSPEGESVPLGKNLKARGYVEDWLSQVEARMKTSLHGFMKAGLLDYDTKPRDEWVGCHPGQVVATVAQMTWARGTEKALRADDPVAEMERWYDTYVVELTKLIVRIRGDLSKLERSIIVALVTTDVHARDIIDELHENKASVDSMQNFTWQQQLRYYWDMDLDDCLVRHSDARIRYGYEYMGATSRLVITPLTDRCWLTLTGSYELKLGAAPAGPAGTGKTETSKDLAKACHAIGILCVVFNCSDQIDYKMMGKLFRGLAQGGSWVCLDEFNRIDIEVLSVIAQQLLVLRGGRLMAKPDINFMGVQIALKDHHVVITMNPGYAGRTELPDNLAVHTIHPRRCLGNMQFNVWICESQVCFRPVAMMVPNYALIAEIMLFAEGFADAKTLSRKMCKLYILCSEQLSQQPHYDYGLRAVKSVLVMAGSLKRGYPEVDEDLTLIRALVDSNVPKFLADDLPLFAAIVKDLFPGLEVPSNDYGEFSVELGDQLDKHGLQKVPLFMGKIIQLFDIFNIRFGGTLVGPTGAGKTTCYRMLAAVMTSLRNKGSTNPEFQVVKYEVLNPKCITMGELYGEFNPLTQEWHDGLASTIMRRAVADEGEHKRWTVFDGPIDALWIENMNTVLDDNMTLCLANGERIKLKIEMKMLFEVMDLAVASPATVSRIGVIYMTPSNLGWMPYVQSWIPTGLPEAFPRAARDHLLHLFEACVQKGLDFQRRQCKEPVACVDIQLVTSLSFILQSLIVKAVDSTFSLPEAELNAFVDKLFVSSFVWSIAGSVQEEGWERMNDFCRDLFEAEGLQLGFPTTLNFFDVYVDPVTREFRPWEDAVKPFSYDPVASYFEMMVPTVDTTRFSSIFSALISQQDKPVFVTGTTGTGKTVTVQNLLSSLEPPEEEGGQNVIPVTVNFSAQTSSLVTQASIEGKLEKKRKNLLGAPAAKKVVIFVDDVNMPVVEEYGAQAPIELLRQFLDFKGFYDRDKLFWKEITDTMLITGAAPPGGGRSEVTPRFVRHFNVFCVPQASTSAMQLIFSSMLKGFLASKFDGEIKDRADGIVNATIEVYERISQELLPTPARFHYTFNLRDISKVFQGILMITASRCQTVETAVRLWAHECSRVFYDRLINRDDQQWFVGLILELLPRFLKVSWEKEDLFDEGSPVIFCDFLRPGADKRLYEESRDMTKMKQILDDSLDEYNVTFANHMNLVFFADAVVHVARIGRVLRQPRGNAMLVGVGGSGKQSLTRVASYVAGYECVQIEINRGYGLPEFREDVKKLMIKTGVEGKHVTFLFTDTQIVVETMLEDLNNVLNSGEVPNLFPQDEQDKVAADMIPVCKELGVSEARDSCLFTFVTRVRENLHVVLCVSPVGDALRVRCRNFPSLINCTTIDWFFPWPEAALVSVAERFLEGVPLPSDEVRMGLIRMCGVVHTSIKVYADKFYDELLRRVYTTPKSYLDLINSYTSKLGQLQGGVQTKASQMEARRTCVTKLNETNAMVEGLKKELTKLEPVLERASRDAEKLLKQVEVDKADAAKVKAKVEIEEAEVVAQADEVKVVQADAQADLDVAMPTLEKALKALDSLTKNDITEVKSFAKPPPAVQIVMEAVCILLESKTDWDAAKKILADSSFMEKLKTYDKDNISPAILKKIKPYVENPNMQVDVVTKVSKAASGLCMFVHAMDVYSKVAKVVAPKKAKLEEMNALLAAANGALATKQAELRAVNEKVEALEAQCAITLQEKKRLADEADTTAKRLVRAEKLTSGLASEGVRWLESLDSLGKQKVALIGDAFLSCGCLSYYGPFTGSYRDDLVTSWVERVREEGIPSSDGGSGETDGAGFSLIGTLGDPVEIRGWQNWALPTDKVSTDSAILVTKGSRWPLMIDPQGQANKWIKKMHESDDIEVTTMTNAKLLRSLENCIRVGRPLLIEDITEHIEPALEPVLQKATFKQGNRTLIRIGDSDVDYNDSFKMYLTTKMPNPHYLPEVCIKVNVINFTVTMEGLQDQLLGQVVAKERPDIETRKTQLLLRMAADKKQLSDLEARILHLLSNSSGNILDDEVLINTLADSKTTSSVIKARVEESEKTGAEIDIARKRYTAVAIRGSIIYFVIADLSGIDPMYQYSLQYYQALFDRCMDGADRSDDLAQRLANLVSYSTRIVYGNICRGLFERHKLLFSALICFQILRHRTDIQRDEWGLFLRGAGLVDRSAQPPNPDPTRLTAAQWDIIFASEQLPPASRPSPCSEAGGEEKTTGCEGDNDKGLLPLKGLCESVVNNWNAWISWADGEGGDVWEYRIPDGLFGGDEGKGNGASAFQRLLLVKAFREDQLLRCIGRFVGEKLGEAFAESPAASMEDIYADLDNKTPCIFILSTGADPTSMLLRFAKVMGYADRLSLVSLGQGQGPYAAELVEKGTKTGDWVLLQNCMLAKSWMPALEKIVFGLADAAETNNEAFRLFLTSAPATYFPVSILQNGVKMTNEPPKGIRANVSRHVGLSWANLIKEDDWETCAKRDEFKRMIVGLLFFHANIQERRKFGPLGWNTRYAFDESDLETSIAVLRRFLEEQAEVPWDALRYVTGHINYGGRVTDDWDRRCLMSILGIYVNDGILDSDYRFSESGIYYAPNPGSFQAVSDYFSQLPVVDSPEIFGMHENANVTFNTNESLNLMQTILSLQPRESSGGGGKSNDDIVTELAEELESQVPALLLDEDAGPTTFVVQENGLLLSLAIVLKQEMVKFNRLLSTMVSSITELRKAIKGLVVMSLDLDRMYTSFMNNQLPALWGRVSFASLKSLASWNKDLLFRVAFMRGWLKGGQPMCFPLPVFFFPQGFMTGTLQTFARKYQVAIDTLTYKFDVMRTDPSEVIEGPSDGVYCHGLWLEGARWDANAWKLRESRPGEMYTHLPLIHFVPAEGHKTAPGDYACPVYKTAERKGVLSTTGMSTNFVVAVELPTDVSPHVWVMFGVAAVCNLTE
ncbi:unnamed protein product [Ascophyllum nodosum]